MNHDDDTSLVATATFATLSAALILAAFINHLASS